MEGLAEIERTGFFSLPNAPLDGVAFGTTAGITCAAFSS